MSEDEQNLDESILHFTPHGIPSPPHAHLWAAKPVYLRDLPVGAIFVERKSVMTCFVSAFIIQTQLRSADVVTNVNEMTVLCRELLTLGDLEGPPPRQARGP